MSRPHFHLAALTPVFAAGALMLGLPADAATPARTVPQTKPTWDLCATAVSATETRNKIPSRLLTAMSLVESGRWNPRAQRSMAWPWTVHAQGKGRFFPSKKAAVAAVRALQKRGVRSIDVGCMQVNLHYHPKAFRSLDAAFDPKRNAAYAATFLKALKREHKSWRRAVQHYHSATPDRRVPYQERVYAVWQDAASMADAKATRRNKARLRRIARQVNAAHRAKRNAHRTGHAAVKRPKAAPGAVPGKTHGRATRGLANWPPRSVKAQRRAQILARSRALTPTPATKQP